MNLMLLYRTSTRPCIELFVEYKQYLNVVLSWWRWFI
jgi:hypothetical protein